MANVVQKEVAVLPDGTPATHQNHYTQPVSVGENKDSCHPAEIFLRFLDPSTDQFCFRTFDDTKADRSWVARKFNGTFQTHRNELMKLNHASVGVFAVINAGGQNTGSIKRIRAVFADTDGAPLEPLLTLMPHAVIESSPGKWHVYWLVDDAFPVDKFAPTQKSIANKFGTDKTVNDLPRVMRLPGFNHCKSTAVEVRIQSINPQLPKYTFGEIVNGLGLGLQFMPDTKGLIERGKNFLPLNPLFAVENTINQGGRNSAVLSYVGKLRNDGVPETYIWGMARTYNAENCQPPLDESEVLDIVNRYAEQSNNTLSLPDGLIEFSDCLPPPRDFTIASLLLAGKSAVLGGRGGVAKSQAAIQAGISVALGKDFLGRPTKSGAVILLFGEEDKAEINRRIAATSVYMGLTYDEKHIVRAHLRALPMTGIDMRFAKHKNGSMESTNFMESVHEKARLLEHESGLAIRLIVLDHAGLIHGGDFNAREDVVRTMSIVNELADRTGAAVLVLAHSPKSDANRSEASSDDIAGSTAWVDNARAAFILKTMTADEAKKYAVSEDSRKDYVSLSSVKGNYIPPDQKIWLLRKPMEQYETIVLDPVNLQIPVKAPMGANRKLRSKILELVSGWPCLTRNKLEMHAGKDGTLGVSKDKVRIELDSMLNEGLLTLRDPTENERVTHRLRGQTSGILMLGKPF